MTAVRSNADLIVRAEEHASTHPESAEILTALVTALREMTRLVIGLARSRRGCSG